VPRRERLAAAALAALALLFAAGLFRLLALRLVGGDVYPPSSSLRADPLGTRALHDALARLPGLSVSRNHVPLARLGDGAGTTLFVLGTADVEDEDETGVDGAALRRFVGSGGRLVLGLLGAETRSVFAAPQKRERPSRDDRLPERTPRPSPSPSSALFVAKGRGLLEGWGVGLTRHKLAKGVKPTFGRATSAADALSLPAELTWHGETSFETKMGWSILYTSSGYPVLVERRIGAGSVVLLSDSYPASNEAMVKERRPALLSYLAGSSGRVVFDETHLGVLESEGVASLGRRYRLTPFLASLLVLAGLFVWKNATSLLPRRDARSSREDAVSGRDSFSGLVGLLTRGLAPKELGGVLVDEWARTAAEGRPLEPRLREAAGSAPDPVTAYRKLRRITISKGAA
jgi:hypothetical protein